MLTIDEKGRHNYDEPYLPGEKLTFRGTATKVRIDELGDESNPVPKWHGFAKAGGEGAANLPLRTKLRSFRIVSGQEVYSEWLHTIEADGWLSYEKSPLPASPTTTQG